jgi:hypothetical protein
MEYDRDLAINHLLADDFKSTPRLFKAFVIKILEYGHVGYRNMTNYELKTELVKRYGNPNIEVHE